jgi:hypothetical protein
MQDLQVTSATDITTRARSSRIAARWMVTFIGFPVGGAAAWVAGPIDSVGAALLGGLLAGAVLGAVQVWGLGSHRPPVGAWIAATAVGLMTGLTMGATLVDYDTSLDALLIQGGITGFVVGAAQALVLLSRFGVLAFAWPPALGAIWVAGWAVSTSIGIDVDEQFTTFGASGALVVTFLSVVLPLAIDRNGRKPV